MKHNFQCLLRDLLPPPGKQVYSNTDRHSEREGKRAREKDIQTSTSLKFVFSSCCEQAIEIESSQWFIEMDTGA